MKLVIIIILVAILASLGLGLWFLAKDDQGSTRVLTALKIRVLLSAILIGFLVFGYFQGWISPHTSLEGSPLPTADTRLQRDRSKIVSSSLRA